MPYKMCHPVASARGDRYETPDATLDAVLDRLKPGTKLWEPFVGSGRSTRRMRARGFDVVNGKHRDFFKQKPPPGRILVSNPPFSLKGKIFDRLRELDVDAILLIPVESLHTNYFTDIVEARGLHVQILYSCRRVRFVDAETGECTPKGFPWACAWISLCREPALRRDVDVFDPEDAPAPVLARPRRTLPRPPPPAAPCSAPSTSSSTAPARRPRTRASTSRTTATATT